MAELGQATGQQVFQGNLRYSLTQAFGPDASLKAQAYLGVITSISLFQSLLGMVNEHRSSLVQPLMQNPLSKRRHAL